MKKSRLKLSTKLSDRLKVKSFSTVMDKAEQKTTKGGYKINSSQFGVKDPWTEIKSGKGTSLRYVNEELTQTGKNIKKAL